MTNSLIKDWTSLYDSSKLKNWGLPAFEIMDPQQNNFSKLYLKSSEIPDKTEDGNKIDFYTICADVFVIDKPIEVNRSTYIFARRIEIMGGAKLSLNRMKEPVALLLAAQEVVDEKGEPAKLTIDVTSKKEKYTSNYSVVEGSQVAVMEWEDDPRERQYPIKDLDEDYLLEAEPLRVHLRCLFQLATLLSTDHYQLSIQQYNWVADLASASNDTRTICGEAQALASITEAQNKKEDVTLVPDLDYSLYAESANAFLQLFDIRQRKQDLLEQSIGNNKNWLAAAKDVLQQNISDEKLNKQLLNKAKNTRNEVLEARATVARQITLQRIVLSRCERNFEAGIEIWKIDQTIKAIFNIIMGVFKMLSAFPSMVIAGPGAGLPAMLSTVSGIVGLAAKGVGKTIGVSGRAPLSPSAGAGGAILFDEVNKDRIKAELNDRVINATTDAAQARTDQADFNAYVDNLDQNDLNNLDFDNTNQAKMDQNAIAITKADAQVVKATKKAKQATDGLRKQSNVEFDKGIKEIQQGAGEVMDAAMALVAANAKAKKLKDAAQKALLASNEAIEISFSSIELRGLDTITGGAQIWDDFTLKVEKLFEKSPVLEEIEGGSEYRKEMKKLLLLGKTYALTRLAVAKADAELAEMIMRERSSKQSVSIYENRVAELDEKAVNDSTVAQLAYGKILDAKRSVYLAMESYRRAFLFHTLADESQVAQLPKFYSSFDEFYQAGANIVGKRTAAEMFQDKPATIPLNPYTISKEDLPETLFEEGVLNIPITTSHPWFESMYRIRLKKVRVFALGLESDGNIKVTISNSGTYEDKTKKGSTKTFAASPLKVNFIYDANDLTNIRQETEVARRFENDFFFPTPFTNWTIQFNHQNGKTLDYNTITGLRVEFSGEASSMLI